MSVYTMYSCMVRCCQEEVWATTFVRATTDLAWDARNHLLYQLLSTDVNSALLHHSSMGHCTVIFFFVIVVVMYLDVIGRTSSDANRSQFDACYL